MTTLGFFVNLMRWSLCWLRWNMIQFRFRFVMESWWYDSVAYPILDMWFGWVVHWNVSWIVASLMQWKLGFHSQDIEILLVHMETVHTYHFRWNNNFIAALLDFWPWGCRKVKSLLSLWLTMWLSYGTLDLWNHYLRNQLSHMLIPPYCSLCHWWNLWSSCTHKQILA